MGTGIIPADFGVWFATKKEMLETSRKIPSHNEEILLNLLEDDLHLVVPIISNQQVDPIYSTVKCLVWVKVIPQKDRICGLMDFDLEDLERFKKPTEKQMIKIIRILLENEPLLNISEFYNVKGDSE